MPLMDSVILHQQHNQFQRQISQEQQELIAQQQACQLMPQQEVLFLLQVLILEHLIQ